MPQRFEELGLDLVQRLRHDRSPEDYNFSMFEQLKNLSDSAAAFTASAYREPRIGAVPTRRCAGIPPVAPHLRLTLPMCPARRPPTDPARRRRCPGARCSAGWA